MPWASFFRQLFRDFPVQLTIVIICLTISAIVGVVPAVYIERLTGYIEQGLETGWASVLPQMGKAIGTMISPVSGWVGLLSDVRPAAGAHHPGLYA